MKTIDEGELQKTTKEKQTKTERSKGNRTYSERVRAKWFCWAFKLGFLQFLDALSIRKRLLRRTINKRNKELQHLSKELSLSENFLSTQLSTIDFYILTKSITSYNKKLLQKSLYTQQKKLSSLRRDSNLPVFTAKETFTNLTLYELSQEEPDLLKASL